MKRVASVHHPATCERSDSTPSNEQRSLVAQSLALDERSSRASGECGRQAARGCPSLAKPASTLLLHVVDGARGSVEGTSGSEIEVIDD